MSDPKDAEGFRAALANGHGRQQQARGPYVVGTVLVLVIGLISVVTLIVNWPLRLGIDVVGGTRLVYVVKEDQRGELDMSSNGDHSRMDVLVKRLHRRIDPSATHEVMVRNIGMDRIEILLPALDPNIVDRVKQLVGTVGVLRFRIVANRRDHPDVIELAEKAARDETTRLNRYIVDGAGERVGLWAKVGREQPIDGELRPFRFDITGYTLRDAANGKLLDIPVEVTDDANLRGHRDRCIRLAQYAAEQNLQEIEVLLSTSDGLNVGGSHLASVTHALDEYANPALYFELTEDGIPLLEELTNQFKSDGDFLRQLAIVLDDVVLSAPNIQERISERGRITGHFTEDEVAFLASIFSAGSLPVPLGKQPITEEPYRPAPSSARSMQSIIAVGLGGLLFACAGLTLCHGWIGAAASVSSLVQLIASIALLSMTGATFTVPLITVVIVMTLIVTGLNATVSACKRQPRNSPATATKLVQFHRLLANGGWTFLYVLIFVTGYLIHAVSGYELRNLALGVMSGSLTGLITDLCLWYPSILTAHGQDVV